MELIPNYNTMHQYNDSIRFLKEIRASVFEFENQAYIHNSILTRVRQQEHEINKDYRKRFKEQLTMLDLYRGAFGNDEGLVLDEYRERLSRQKEPKETP